MKNYCNSRAYRIKATPGQESVKLMKLTEGDDIEAFLVNSKQALKVHGVERDEVTIFSILAPQLNDYATMMDTDAMDYDGVKVTIFRIRTSVRRHTGDISIN